MVSKFAFTDATCAATTWFLAGQVVAPGGGVLINDGAVWSVVFIWLGAQIGGATATLLKLPPLLGMLLSGGGLYKSSAVVTHSA
jgi:hypothetical protein